jgi:hypothetical protein
VAPVCCGTCVAKMASIACWSKVKGSRTCKPGREEGSLVAVLGARVQAGVPSGGSPVLHHLHALPGCLVQICSHLVHHMHH